MAKRVCKNINIGETEFITPQVKNCVDHKTAKNMERTDIVKLFESCNWNNEKVAEICSQEIQKKDLHMSRIRYDVRTDPSNGKTRIIAIEGIKQQIYDYVAYHGLDELASYIGHYQIACKDNMGPLFGAKVIQTWMNERTVRIGRDGEKIRSNACRYAIKTDLRHAYASITHENIMAWLKHRVANKELLWLIDSLLKTVEQGYPSRQLIAAMDKDPKLREQYEQAMHGLPIGSVLSIRLCALYVADVYHYVEDNFAVVRRGKRIRTFRHQMFNIDDMYFFGSNARQMTQAMPKIMKYCQSKGLEIKSNWQLIDLNPRNKNAHIDVLGYRIYRDRITMRRRDYLKTKKALRKYEKDPTVKNARSLMSYTGLFVKHTDSMRFCKKYDVFKITRKARKTISKYDKGTIHGEAAGSQNNRSGQRTAAVPDLSARRRNHGAGSELPC